VTSTLAIDRESVSFINSSAPIDSSARETYPASMQARSAAARRWESWRT
jgi:hypothetical protein